jgi:hypothetical protein
VVGGEVFCGVLTTAGLVVALSPFSSVAPDLKVLSLYFHAVRHHEGGGWGSVVLFGLVVEIYFHLRAKLSDSIKKGQRFLLDPFLFNWQARLQASLQIPSPDPVLPDPDRTRSPMTRLGDRFPLRAVFPDLLAAQVPVRRVCI